MERRWFRSAACPTFRSDRVVPVEAAPAESEAELVVALEPVAQVGLEQALV
jgi:hypothetical protein